MKLYTPCIKCKKDISIKSTAIARPELAKEKGDKLKVRCESCLTIQETKVNDVKAKSNPNIVYAAVALGVFLTVFFWEVFGLYGTLTFSIPIIIKSQQESSVSSFNSYKTIEY